MAELNGPAVGHDAVRTRYEDLFEGEPVRVRKTATEVRCSPAELVACCEPAAKSSCCGPEPAVGPPTTCGCGDQARVPRR